MGSTVNPRKLAAVSVTALVIAALTWTAWLAWATQRDLAAARMSIEELRVAVERGDIDSRARSVERLKRSTESAMQRTDGIWWGALTHFPWIGDDAEGVQVLSASLSSLSSDAIDPLVEVVGDLDSVTIQGRIDVQLVRSLEQPVDRAFQGVSRSADMVAELESSGFIGPLRLPFDDYVQQVNDLQDALASARLATSLAPAMLGEDGSRDYLLIFQNNAEIRGTGGLPGSWALVHAENGKVSIREQGSSGDFPILDRPVAPLTTEEVAVYGQELGRFWQDPGFTPDFPRAAELFNAFWMIDNPGRPLDGILTLDPVALGYLLQATGPVDAAGLTVTPDNASQLLLNQIYLDNENPRVQDLVFQAVARAIFDAVTTDVESPLNLVKGLSRASEEGRFLVAPFREDERAAIDGTSVEGALAEDDGKTVHVDIGLNDATGSKMSYYLRYWADVSSRDCVDGTQHMNGSLTLNQTISPAEAQKLPDYITGGGVYGTEPGTQLVFVRIYGPYGGELSELRINGSRPAFDDIDSLGGRPVATLPISLANVKDTLITWSMRSGPGQTGATEIRLTPSVVPGTLNRRIASSC